MLQPTRFSVSIDSLIISQSFKLTALVSFAPLCHEMTGQRSRTGLESRCREPTGAGRAGILLVALCLASGGEDV